MSVALLMWVQFHVSRYSTPCTAAIAICEASRITFSGKNLALKMAFVSDNTSSVVSSNGNGDSDRNEASDQKPVTHAIDFSKLIRREKAHWCAQSTQPQHWIQCTTNMYPLNRGLSEFAYVFDKVKHCLLVSFVQRPADEPPGGCSAGSWRRDRHAAAIGP